MKNMADIVWHQSKNVLDAIKSHPFNIELATGKLAMDKFAYYIEQDARYLQDFARSLAMIAARVPLEFINDFLLFSQQSLIAEQEMVHDHFKKNIDFKTTGRITPATFSYTHYLLQTSANAPVAVAIAAILPCFWIYRDVGLSIAKNAAKNNPYLPWIDAYSSDAFAKTVKKAIAIFNEIAEMESAHIREEMKAAFYKSTVLEWHFWHDAYHKKSFDLFS